MKTSTNFAAIQARSTYPGSCKRYFVGSRPDLNAPYREVSLSDTRHSDGIEQNGPLPLYDTSGSYTDPLVGVDLTRGLRSLRAGWIEDRQDTEELIGPSSEYASLRDDALLALLERFPCIPRPRRALSGRNVTQMHYARKGMITPEMEFVALRESMQLDQLAQDPTIGPLLVQHPGHSFGAHMNEITPESV
jgi:phosphomethylpyrimidine synthase